MKLILVSIVVAAALTLAGCDRPCPDGPPWPKTGCPKVVPDGR